MRRFLLLFAAVFLSLAAVAEQDVLTLSAFGVKDGAAFASNLSYTSATTGIKYNGRFGGNSSNMQLNSTSPAGIVVVSNPNGYVLKKVTVVWASNTSDGKVITIYGKNSAYTDKQSAQDLYNSSTSGTKLGEIKKGTSTELSASSESPFVGIKASKSGTYITSITLDWELPSASTVAAPTVSAEYNVVTLACATEGAKIYYTTDGAEPTAESEKYTAPFTITKPTTVKAIAITSEGSSKVTTEKVTYYITKMSEFNTIADATGYKVHLTDAIVAAADNSSTKKRIFLTDGTDGVMIFYSSGYTEDAENPYAPGDVIATVDGDLSITTKSAQITNAVLGKKVAGPAPTPTVATLDMFVTDNINKYVVVNNVEFTKESSKYYISDGTNKVECYNSLNIKDIPDNGTYNVEGFILKFYDTWEIIPTKIVAKSLSFLATSMGVVYGNEVPALPINNPKGLALTWSSSNDKVATVDAAGNVTVVGVGTTTIKAAETGNESNYAELTFTVSPAAGNISYFAEKFVVLKGADFVAPVLTNPHGLTVTYVSDNDAVAVVDENTGEITVETGTADVTATITATAAAQGNYAASTASYTIVIKDPSIVVDGPTETLTASDFKATSTTYTSGTSTKNEFSYAFETAKNSNGAIQLRATNPGGIIVTANDKGYVLRKVTVEWNSATANGRTLDVYGKNTAYTGNYASNLYNNSTKGTKLGSIVYGTSTELVIEGDYQFIGLRSNDNALMLTSITLIWEAPAVPEYSSTLTLGNETINDVKANTLSLAKVGDDLGSYNVYLNSTEIGAANNECNYLPYSTNGNFTISDGITAYALTTNTLNNLTQQVGEVTDVQYIALREDKYLVPGKTDEWYLSAEYTIAPKEPALKDMVVTLSDFEITYEGHGEFSAFNGNKVTVAKVGTFKFVTNKVNDKDVTTAVYTIDKECLFGVNLNFPFFVYGSLKDMMQKSLGIPTLSTIKSTMQTAVYVGEVAQPDDTEGIGNVSGVESVVVDSEGAVEYYNLQGVRVEGALTPGIYIRRSGNTATKISIR